MLWSDPPDDPPEELQEAQAMLRRVWVVIAIAMVVLMFVLGIGML
ncbi:morphogenic membrane protein MmpB [Streptomyces sp. H27-D2]|nr:hypothetical protein [Streptomyces sp. H27-D2]MEC4019547.1 hypothetical protein [Streptomyces sp. H27-D2]